MTVDEIRHIAVVGAGLMGHGIAQEFALAGYEVHLHSRREESLQTALNNIQANLERLIGMGVVTRVQAEAVPARLHPTPVLAQAVAGVFEIFELAGWDLLNAIAAGLFPHLASSPEVPQVLEEKVAHGELGVKTGKGFYEWTPESAEALRQRIARALVAIERWA